MSYLSPSNHLKNCESLAKRLISQDNLYYFGGHKGKNIPSQHSHDKGVLEDNLYFALTSLEQGDVTKGIIAEFIAKRPFPEMTREFFSSSIRSQSKKSNRNNSKDDLFPLSLSYLKHFYGVEREISFPKPLFYDLLDERFRLHQTHFINGKAVITLHEDLSNFSVGNVSSISAIKGNYECYCPFSSSSNNIIQQGLRGDAASFEQALEMRTFLSNLKIC